MFSVLIVEDNPVDAKIIEHLLKKKNYSTRIAKDGHEAIELLENYSFQLILLDWQLPGANGIDLLRTIRKIPKFILTPIMIVSGKNEIKDVQKAVQAGANDYVVKPIDLMILDGKVSRLLNNEIEWSPINIQNPEFCKAEIPLSVVVTQVSEVGIEIKSDFLIPLGQSFNVQMAAFANSKVSKLFVKVFEEEIRNGENFYKCSLVGMKEADLKEIRLLLRSLQLEKKAQTAG